MGSINYDLKKQNGRCRLRFFGSKMIQCCVHVSSVNILQNPKINEMS